MFTTENQIMIMNSQGALIPAEIVEEPSLANVKSEKFELAQYPWVDTKTELCYKWVKVGPLKTKIPYPCIFTKNCKNKLILTVYYPADVQGDIEETLKKCALESVLLAIPYAAPQFIAGDYPGAVSTAIGKFSEKFPNCVGGELAGKVSIDFSEEKICGDWVRV